MIPNKDLKLIMVLIHKNRELIPNKQTDSKPKKNSDLNYLSRSITKVVLSQWQFKVMEAWCMCSVLIDEQYPAYII